MGDFDLFFGIIPERAYKYIVMALVGLFVFKNRIPILDKIDVRIHLPDEFMRHFRWITPLLSAIQLIFLLVIYRVLMQILNKAG